VVLLINISHNCSPSRSNPLILTHQTPSLLRRFHLSAIKVTTQAAPRNDKSLSPHIYPCHCEARVLSSSRSNLTRLAHQTPRLLRRFHLSAIKVTTQTAPRKVKFLSILISTRAIARLECSRRTEAISQDSLCKHRDCFVAFIC
jgi:hypothetical protein